MPALHQVPKKKQKRVTDHCHANTQGFFDFLWGGSTDVAPLSDSNLIGHPIGPSVTALDKGAVVLSPDQWPHSFEDEIRDYPTEILVKFKKTLPWLDDIKRELKRLPAGSSAFTVEEQALQQFKRNFHKAVQTFIDDMHEFRDANPDYAGIANTGIKKMRALEKAYADSAMTEENAEIVYTDSHNIAEDLMREFHPPSQRGPPQSGLTGPSRPIHDAAGQYLTVANNLRSLYDDRGKRRAFEILKGRAFETLKGIADGLKDDPDFHGFSERVNEITQDGDVNDEDALKIAIDDLIKEYPNSERREFVARPVYPLAVRNK